MKLKIGEKLAPKHAPNTFEIFIKFMSGDADAYEDVHVYTVSTIEEAELICTELERLRQFYKDHKYDRGIEGRYLPENDEFIQAAARDLLDLWLSDITTDGSASFERVSVVYYDELAMKHSVHQEWVKTSISDVVKTSISDVAVTSISDKEKELIDVLKSWQNIGTLIMGGMKISFNSFEQMGLNDMLRCTTERTDKLLKDEK